MERLRLGKVKYLGMLSTSLSQKEVKPSHLSVPRYAVSDCQIQVLPQCVSYVYLCVLSAKCTLTRDAWVAQLGEFSALDEV